MRWRSTLEGAGFPPVVDIAKVQLFRFSNDNGGERRLELSEAGGVEMGRLMWFRVRFFCT